MDSGNGSARRALLVATSSYADNGLAQLVSPAADAVALGGVLAAAKVGGFGVSTMLNGSCSEIAQAVEDFAAEGERSDLVLLYLSCHGLKDEQGRLYFAATDTRRERLRSTAVAAAFVNDVLLSCRSRQKVLLLDCCFSGAFARGLSVKADPAVHTADQFDARGLVVLTASDATQYAFQGETVTGHAAPSAFTATVVDGLTSGAADLDGDGLVSVEDLYEYTRRRLAEQQSPQRPRKWEFDVGGTIVLARSARSATDEQQPVLPVVLSVHPRTESAPQSSQRTSSWWAGAALFTVAAACFSFLLDWWLSGLPIVEQQRTNIQDTNVQRLAVVIGGVGWGVVYALADAARASPGGLSSVFRQWTAQLKTVARPANLRSFLTGAAAALPFNIVVVTVLASAAAAAMYAQTDNSDWKNKIFNLVYYMVTLFAWSLYLTRTHPPRSNTSTGPIERTSP